MGLLRQIQPISFVDSEYTNFVLFFALAYAFFLLAFSLHLPQGSIPTPSDAYVLLAGCI